MKNVFLALIFSLACTGIHAQVYFNSNNVNGGLGCTSIGRYSTSNALNSITIGTYNSALAKDALVIGTSTTITAGADYGMSFGHRNRINGQYSFAFGNKNNVQSGESYALGRGVYNDVPNSLMIGMLPDADPAASPALFVNQANRVVVNRDANLGNPAGYLDVNAPADYQYDVMNIRQLANGHHQRIMFVANAGDGFFNYLTKESDKGIFYSDSRSGAANLDAGFVIAPWAHSNKGIRIDGSGKVGIGVKDPNGYLDVKAPDDYQYDIMNLQQNANGNQQRIMFVANAGDGFFNYLTKEGDKGIFYTDSRGDWASSASNRDAGFVIAPWVHSDKGMRIDGSGNVGIGLKDPLHELAVQGNGQFFGKGLFSTDYTDGTVNVAGTADLYPSEERNAALRFRPMTPDASEQNRHLIYDDQEENALIIAPGADGGMMTGGISLLKVAGEEVQVQIGNERPNMGDHTDFRLAVDGKLLVRDAVVVTTSNWADFVFADDYTLMSLEDLETFIKANRHLPTMPSAEEAIAEGVDLKQMNIQLLQQVEELSLHLIQLNKEVLALKAALNE